MPDNLSGLIWVQTVCKVYQQTRKLTASRQRTKDYLNLETVIYAMGGYALKVGYHTFLVICIKVCLKWPLKNKTKQRS